VYASAPEHITACALEHAKKNGGIPALYVYRNCSKPTPPLEPKEEREAFTRNWDALEEFFAHWERLTENDAVGKLNSYRNLKPSLLGHPRQFVAERDCFETSLLPSIAAVPKIRSRSASGPSKHGPHEQ
jgi:hypothetical protein